MSGRHSRMLDTVASFASTSCWVTLAATVRCCAWIASRPNAVRVAAMLRSMYGRSRCSSWGPTWNRWTNAGYAAPAVIDTSASRPRAMTGMAQPRIRMFTRNRIAHATAMNVRMRRAGSCAFTSVNEAPSTTPRCDVVPPGLRQHDEPEQDRQMRLDLWRDLLGERRGLGPDPTPQVVGNRRDERDPDER